MLEMSSVEQDTLG